MQGMPAISSDAIMRTLIFLYARISLDPRDRKRGVRRQMQDLRRYAAEELAGEVAGEYTENDVSAHADVERPEYDALMAAAIAAAAQPNTRVIIAAYHPSRLWRRPVERAQAIEDLRRVRAWVGFESGGLFNLSKSTDRSQLRQVGESDTAESEVKSERVARAARERAEEGRANGKVAYGWQRHYKYDERGQVDGFDDLEHPEQAPIVREIVARLLGGETVIGITADLNRRRIPSPGAGQQRKHRTLGQNEDGSLWNKTSLKKVALRPANIALRVHHGELYPATWPRLISDEDHARLKAMFATRAATGEKPGLRKHLLSWGEVATCGVCGGHLRSATKGNAKHGHKQLTYVCASNSGCVGRNQAALDEFVGEIAIAILSDPAAADLFRPDDTAAMAALERAEALRAKQGNSADDFAAGLITRDQLHRITQTLKQQITAAQEEARRLMPAANISVLDGLVGPQARERWGALTVPQQRTALEVIGLRIKVHPATRRGPGFDKESIEVFVPRRGEPSGS